MRCAVEFKCRPPWGVDLKGAGAGGMTTNLGFDSALTKDMRAGSGCACAEPGMAVTGGSPRGARPFFTVGNVRCCPVGEGTLLLRVLAAGWSPVLRHRSQNSRAAEAALRLGRLLRQGSPVFVFSMSLLCSSMI